MCVGSRTDSIATPIAASGTKDDAGHGRPIVPATLYCASMAGSSDSDPLGRDGNDVSPRTPGALGSNDAASPDSPVALTGDTPGALGRNDWGDPDHPSYVLRLPFPSPGGGWTPPNSTSLNWRMPFLTPLSLAPGNLAWLGQFEPTPWSTQNDPVPDPQNATAGDPSGGIDSVIRALDQKTLRADKQIADQLRGVARDGFWTDAAGHVLRASPELVNLLAGLVGGGGATLTIMSLFRFKNGPHGEEQGDGTAIGRAVDIMEYKGFPINLKTPANASNAIAGVAAVIAGLAPGKYTLGLPRPGGGKLMDPDHDVFLPVTNLDQVTKSPGRGDFKKDLALVREPAQTALRAAANGNPKAHIQFMFPDGVDHVHVKAVP